MFFKGYEIEAKLGDVTVNALKELAFEDGSMIVDGKVKDYDRRAIEVIVGQYCYLVVEYKEKGQFGRSLFKIVQKTD